MTESAPGAPKNPEKPKDFDEQLRNAKSLKQVLAILSARAAEIEGMMQGLGDGFGKDLLDQRDHILEISGGKRPLSEILSIPEPMRSAVGKFLLFQGQKVCIVLKDGFSTESGWEVTSLGVFDSLEDADLKNVISGKTKKEFRLGKIFIDANA